VLFAMKSQPPKEQPFLIALESPDKPASERIVVDPNRLDSGGTTAIDFHVPSTDGKLVAVSLSEGGSESGDVHIFEVATGKALADVIPRVNGGTAGGSLAWNADGSGFYYTRYPRGAERPKKDMGFYQQVYLHRLGTKTEEDAYSLGKDFPRIAEIALQSSSDGRWILATMANGDGGEFAHYLLGPNGEWRQIAHAASGALPGGGFVCGHLRHAARGAAPNGAFNVTEFGTVKELDQFRALYAYSPYHHVVDGTQYPAVFFLTGDNDPRVDPANSRKMTARLQASGTGRLVLLRTSGSSGHGIGTGLSEQIAEKADAFAFLFDQLGVK
jgi:prolyl oligopeptidase PreP (S9A serine peptidase family)